MYEDIQWFLVGHPMKETDIEIEYRLEIDHRVIDSIPKLIRNQLDEITILEHEIGTLQANALKRMNDLQEKVERYEKIMAAQAKEIIMLKEKQND